MIIVEQIPFNSVDAKELANWLKQPGCDLFVRHLASQEAQSLAEGANIAEEDDQNSQDEAKEQIDKARVFRACVDFIRQSKKIALENEVDTRLEKEHVFYEVTLKPETLNLP
jgi:hypothetical protein